MDTVYPVYNLNTNRLDSLCINRICFMESGMHVLCVVRLSYKNKCSVVHYLVYGLYFGWQVLMAMILTYQG